MSIIQRIGKDLQADQRTMKAATLELWKDLGYFIEYHHDTQVGDSPYIRLGGKLFDVWYESPDCAVLFVLDVFSKIGYSASLTETIRHTDKRAVALLSVCWSAERKNRVYAVSESNNNITKARFLALMKVLGKALCDVPST